MIAKVILNVLSKSQFSSTQQNDSMYTTYDDYMAIVAHTRTECNRLGLKLVERRIKTDDLSKTPEERALDSAAGGRRIDKQKRTLGLKIGADHLGVALISEPADDEPTGGVFVKKRGETQTKTIDDAKNTVTLSLESLANK